MDFSVRACLNASYDKGNRGRAGNESHLKESTEETGIHERGQTPTLRQDEGASPDCGRNHVNVR